MRKETYQKSKAIIWKSRRLVATQYFPSWHWFVDGELIGELRRRSIQKYDKIAKFLRYNTHICYVNNINAFFKTFWCTTCDTFFSKTGSLERHLVTCSDLVKHIYPKNVYELRETLFDKLDAFNIPYRNDQKLFKNLANFDFESNSFKEDSYRQIETTTWIELCAYISFYLVNLDPGTHFSLQRQSSSSHLIFYHCSRRISNSKQGSDQTKLYWSKDCNQDKTVCYTGTTQPKTQPSREVAKFCRWM